jgi:hypothetical protein
VGRDSVEPTLERSEASIASIFPFPPRQAEMVAIARASCVGKVGSTECRPTQFSGSSERVPEGRVRRSLLSTESFRLSWNYSMIHRRKHWKRRQTRRDSRFQISHFRLSRPLFSLLAPVPIASFRLQAERAGTPFTAALSAVATVRI